MAETIQVFMETDNIVLNCAAVEAGLAVFLAGGDFADGAIAFEGRMLNDGVFCTFDRKASKIFDSARLSSSMFIRVKNLFRLPENI